MLLLFKGNRSDNISVIHLETLDSDRLGLGFQPGMYREIAFSSSSIVVSSYFSQLK